jgi:hypothetical protein
MNIYFLVLGGLLVLGSLSLFVSRLMFIRQAKCVIGKVERIRRMNYLDDDGGGPSRHIEVSYRDESGINKSLVVDNALLAYVYRHGESVPLAIFRDKVLVDTRLNLAAAPLALLVLGLITMSIYFMGGQAG